MNNFLVNDRICPNPEKWNHLWELLDGLNQNIPKPLILTAWWYTTDSEKKSRFLEHLSIAKKLNKENIINSFLDHLSENEWYHLND